MPCSLSGSSVHVILQARILELVTIPFPGNLHDPETEPRLSAFQADSLLSEPPGKLTRKRNIRSDQISHSPVSDSLGPYESQHSRPPCPSPTPRVQRLTSIESVMPFSHLILCQPLLLLPPIPPSIRVFSNESTLHMRWQKYWSFSFSIIPLKEIPGLISFRMDWLDLLAVQGTLKSLLQNHTSKA